MARTSVLDDLLHISMRLPVWANLAIAGGSFVLLRHYGGSEFPVAALQPQGAAFGEALVGQFGRMAAYVAQFVIPPCFLLGGVIGGSKRWLRTRRFNKLTGDNFSVQGIRDMPWREFESMIGEAFRGRGFRVAETSRGADGGVDLEMHRDGELHLVQCKHWKSRSVGVAVVREIYGVMTARGARSCYVVTSGSFTADAKKFAASVGVHLVDGEQLSDWFRSVRRAPGSAAPAAPSPIEAAKPVEPFVTEPTPTDALCPRCGDAMTPRFKKAGGNAFLGCVNFPRCRGTRQLPQALTTTD